MVVAHVDFFQKGILNHVGTDYSLFFLEHWANAKSALGSKLLRANTDYYNPLLPVITSLLRHYYVIITLIITLIITFYYKSVIDCYYDIINSLLRYYYVIFTHGKIV